MVASVALVGGPRGSVGYDPGMALLTDRDADAVMSEHVGYSIGPRRARNVDGAYTVYWTTPFFRILDGNKQEEVQGRSVDSFEAAILDFAAQRPDLVRLPLDEPTGLFQTLLRHRSAGAAALLNVRAAPLDADTCRMLDELPRGLDRIKSRLVRRIVLSHERGPAAHNIDVIVQALLHRALAMAEGTGGTA
jgi:hypothetical protein